MQKSTGYAVFLLRLQRPALVLLILFLTVSASLADGCYIPLQAVRKIPAITGQRALISWKDDEETLVIASALDSESQKLGWIIPLPAVPDTIEKETPGALRTIAFNIQPRITHDLFPSLKTVFILAFLANLILAVFLFQREDFLSLLLFLFFLMLLSAGTFSALGVAGSSVIKRSSTVQLEKTVRAGVYDISVLRSKKVQDLNSWLAENGFASLPEQAAPIVADYIRDGWVFAAIKLIRDESGANTPHPIKIMFNSKEAVYPLKLTAIAGGNTAFEIFVIADQKVACKSLKEDFCDRFAKDVERTGDGYETDETYLGVGTSVKVGHPAICKVMWGGCVLTKFSGSISSERMTEDLCFSKKPFSPYQRHFYTLIGAIEEALLLMMQLMGMFLFVSMILCKKRIRQPRGAVWYLGRIIVPSLVLSGLCALLVFIAVPKLPSSDVQVGFRWRHSNIDQGVLRMEFARLLDEHPDLAAKQAKEIAECFLTNLVAKRSQPGLIGLGPGNRITGDELRIEDSPGNFTIESGTTNIVLRCYDNTGRPLRLDFLIGKSGGGSK